MAGKVGGYTIREATDIAASAVFGAASKRGLTIKSLDDASAILSELVYSQPDLIVSQWAACDDVPDSEVRRFHRLVKARINNQGAR